LSKERQAESQRYVVMTKLRRFERPEFWRKYRPDKRSTTFSELDDDDDDLILGASINDTKETAGAPASRGFRF
jgi:hypothetical protein